MKKFLPTIARNIRKILWTDESEGEKFSHETPYISDIFLFHVGFPSKDPVKKFLSFSGLPAMQPSCGYEHPEKQAGLIIANFQALLSSRLNLKLYYFSLSLIARRLSRIPSSRSCPSDCIYKKGEQAREIRRNFGHEWKFPRERIILINF